MVFCTEFLIGGGLESRCVDRVYGADGARHHPHRTHETCRAKNILLKLPSCIKLAFHIISQEIDKLTFCVVRQIS